MQSDLIRTFRFAGRFLILCSTSRQQWGRIRTSERAARRCRPTTYYWLPVPVERLLVGTIHGVGTASYPTVWYRISCCCWSGVAVISSSSRFLPSATAVLWRADTRRDHDEASCPAAAAAAASYDDVPEFVLCSAARWRRGRGRCPWMSAELRLLPNNSALHVPAAGRRSRRTRFHHHTVSGPFNRYNTRAGKT